LVFKCIGKQQASDSIQLVLKMVFFVKVFVMAADNYYEAKLEGVSVYYDY